MYVNEIPVIIPSLHPGDTLIPLIRELQAIPMENIILVDDGSGPEYNSIFQEAKDLGCHLLVHEVNKGKGRALKDAFSYCRETFPDLVGVVTADSDGQHTPKDIKRLADELCEHPEDMIFGVRKFDGDDIPWKSSFGNKLTCVLTAVIGGVKVSDTQTGLRAIPADFMEFLIGVKGERFEYEMNCLLESAGRCRIREVEIETIYDSKENHVTHFRPVVDSAKIYKILFKRFFMFCASSLSSSLIDLIFFSCFCYLIGDKGHAVFVSTVLARIISATYNYTVNRRIVFKSREGRLKTAMRFVALSLVIMLLSATGSTVGTMLFPALPKVVVKIVVDAALFILSYTVQKRLVF